MTTMVIRIIEDSREFLSLRPKWRELWAASRDRNPFLAWEWLYPWWEAYGSKREDSRLFLLAVERDGTLVAILPSWMERTQAAIPGFCPRRVAFLGTGEVCSEYLDLLCFGGEEEPAGAATWEWLLANRGAWDVLDFTDMREDAILLRSSHQCCNAATSFREAHSCPCFSLPQDWATYLMSISQKRRYEIRSKRRKLEKKGEVEVHIVSTPEEATEGIEVFRRLHQDRFESRGFDGNFSSLKYTEFHRKAAPLLVESGLLNLVFLKVGESPVAARYQLRSRETVYDYLPGFDTRWSRDSVGLILLSFVIEKAIGSGYRTFDFLRGDESYKFEWATGRQRVFALSVFSDTVAARAEAQRRKVTQATKALLKATLSASLLDLLRKMRRALRTSKSSY